MPEFEPGTVGATRAFLHSAYGVAHTDQTHYVIAAASPEDTTIVTCCDSVDEAAGMLAGALSRVTGEPVLAPESKSVIVRRDDLRAILASAYAPASDPAAFSRLAEVAGVWNGLDRVVPGTYGGCDDVSAVTDDEAALIPSEPAPAASAEARLLMQIGRTARDTLDGAGLTPRVALQVIRGGVETWERERRVPSAGPVGDEWPATKRKMLAGLLESQVLVTVTNPSGGTWTGRIVALADDPSILLQQADGFRACLPQSFEVVPAPEPAEPAPDPGRLTIEAGGYFAKILFFGHIEHVGYVTEITSHGAVAAYHVDLPDKVWGGNPHAEVEYAASAYFGKQRLSEESVRSAWEADRKRAERLRREREEWERRAAERSLTAAATGDDDDPDDYIAHAVGCPDPHDCDGECMEGPAF